MRLPTVDYLVRVNDESPFFLHCLWEKQFLYRLVGYIGLSLSLPPSDSSAWLSLAKEMTSMETKNQRDNETTCIHES